jgi:hypothetical protein
MRRYLRVEWRHDLDEEPVTLLSEIIDGLETRKVEIYRNGRLDYADESRATGTTQLSETLMPSVEEIASQEEFAPEVIDSETFERVWNEAIASHA